METEGKSRKIIGYKVAATSEIKERIRSIRLSKKLSVEDLAEKTLISEKTIKKIENPSDRQRNYLERTLIRIAMGLGVSLEMLLGTSCQSSGCGLSFEFLAEQFSELDQLLLPVIRDHNHIGRNLIEESYRSLVSSNLGRQKIDIQLFNKSLRDYTERGRFLDGLPKPIINVDVSDNLSEISYTYAGDKRFVVKAPLLFWDCSCYSQSDEQDPNCPIHSKKVGAKVSQLFSTGYVLIRYNNMSFYWRDSQELWPPSIDSFYMLNAMKEDGLFQNKYSSILDIGSGTGFLGIVAACKNQYVRNLTLSDWLFTPFLYGNTNWYLNRGCREDIRFNANISLFTNGLDNKVRPHDIAICNPPYLPLLDGFKMLGLESTVAGTDLLMDVIVKSRFLAKKVYIQFSNIASFEANVAATAAGLRLRRVGKERPVPFRLCIPNKKDEYLSTLVHERGLIEDRNSRYRYWHKLQTYVIE